MSAPILACALDEATSAQLRASVGPSPLITCDSIAAVEQHGRGAGLMIARWDADGIARAGLAWAIAASRVAPDCWRILLAGAAAAADANGALERGVVDSVVIEPCTAAQLSAAIVQGRLGERRRRERREQGAMAIERIGLLERTMAERADHLEHAQHELERQNREMVRLETQAVVGRLVRGLAHELNNPLAAILGFAQRLQRRLNADVDAVNRLDVIVHEVDRCRQLVEQLRNLAQPLEEEVLRCQAEPALDQARSHLQQLGREAPPCAIERPLPEVMAAPRSLARVFAQALDNARDAGARSCVLRASSDGTRVRFELANDGRTPTADEIRYAGRPFFSGVPGRRGLGLAIAGALLREQDGALALTARADAPGAATVIWLPAAAAAAGSAASASGATADAPVVLVVDDEPLVAELLRDCFADAGWSTIDCTTMAEALARLRDTPVRAVLADVNLPDGNGADLLRLALSEHPELAGHIALVTGDDRPDHLARIGIDCGALILTKPFRLEQVQALIRAVR
ncbi:MAG TPA: histidine kinase dimerization/phospho-acceptor domain-containing protein [Planctomycetota bacterium]|nr:histidine kinase dimerization/phospho-acceptor domain-containing protein [Planctomycetota bacterium]